MEVSSTSLPTFLACLHIPLFDPLEVCLLSINDGRDPLDSLYEVGSSVFALFIGGFL